MRVLVGHLEATSAPTPRSPSSTAAPSRAASIARFEDGGSSLVLLDQRGDAARTLGAGAGLVAATRFEEQAPTWAITGTDAAGVAAAAARARRAAGCAPTSHSRVSSSGDVPVPLVR